LTGNNTVKMGDFGISKVLESTTQVAMTVVGTPYYLAPEACQSEPYTTKSDIWALGCVIYELCSLTQPFQADNLLGLVFKIVQDEPAPLSPTYSEELRNLVVKMLSKDQTKRPTAKQILQNPLCKQIMREFVSNQGHTVPEGKTIYKKARPTVVRTRP
jgi:NIMA (never in mitosis gene a)-related kinase